MISELNKLKNSVWNFVYYISLWSSIQMNNWPQLNHLRFLLLQEAPLIYTDNMSEEAPAGQDIFENLFIISHPGVPETEGLIMAVPIVRWCHSLLTDSRSTHTLVPRSMGGEIRICDS
jgi:hypothetical protein